MTELRVRRNDDTEAITRLMEQYGESLDAMQLDEIAVMLSSEYYENAGDMDRAVAVAGRGRPSACARRSILTLSGGLLPTDLR